MENWYVPITIVPAIGLLILSTSNLMIALSSELNDLISKKELRKLIISRKLKQLKRLNRAMVLLYLSVASFVLSGLMAGISQTSGSNSNSSIYLAILGIIFAFGALINLIAYSFKAVKIRQDQFQNKC